MSIRMITQALTSGHTARILLRRVGDIDIALDGADERLDALESLGDKELARLHRAASRKSTRTSNKLARTRTRATARDFDRAARNDKKRPKVEAATAWLRVGAGERVDVLNLPRWARAMILLFLGTLDFFVFANAFAVAEDVPNFSLNWWTGGAVGIAVFVQGFFLSHALKRRMLATQQATMLEHARENLQVLTEPLEQLKPAHSNAWTFILSWGNFGVLIGAGTAVRSEGSAGGTSQGITIMLTLVPFIALLAETFMQDPLAADYDQPGVVDQALSRRASRLERRLDAIDESLKAKIRLAEKDTATERRFLRALMRDLGLKA